MNNKKLNIKSISKNGSFKLHSEFATKEFQKKHIIRYEYVDPENKRNKTKRMINKTQTTLDWFYMHNHIDAEQHQAGNLLYEQFIKSGIMQSGGSNFNTMLAQRIIGGKGDSDYTETQIHYRQKIRKIQSYLGTELSNIVFNICCWNVTISEVEQMNKWRSGTGREILKIGLNQLVRYYGIGR